MKNNPLLKPEIAVVALVSLIPTVAFGITGATQARDSGTGKPSGSPPHIAIDAAYGKLPLAFEANDGQIDPKARFLARGQGYNLILEDNEAVLKLTRKTPELAADAASEPKCRAHRTTEPTVLRMKLLGANAKPNIVQADKLPGVVNYYIGADPAKWCSGIATYAKVRFDNVYPGIDLVYYGNQQQLEYDYVIAPHAEPKRIRLGFEGAEKLRIDEQGDLLVEAAGSAVRWRKPVVYQDVRGKRKAIGGKYLLHDGNEVSFEIAEYDASKPLVIDPVLAYSTFIGGTNDEIADGGEDGPGIAVDSNGHAFIAGTTHSTDFPASGFQTGDEGVIVEFNASGSALLYATYFGPNATVAKVAVDTSGNAYIAGEAHVGTPGTLLGDGSDGPYAAKFDSTGALVYSALLGGGGAANAVAVDSVGNAYVAGHQGSNHVLVAKINTNGSALVYASGFGGSETEDANSIAVDGDGNAYVTGITNSSDFPTTMGAFQTANPTGGNDPSAFVTKLDTTGGILYSTYLGGTSRTVGTAIAFNDAGEAYVAGWTSSRDFPVTDGAFQTVFSEGGPFDGSDGFVTKFSADGAAQIYSTFLGGSNYNECHGIAVDSAGDAFVTGITGSTDFPVQDAFQQNAGDTVGADDAFVTEFNPDGSALVYSSYLGDSDTDDGFGIAVDPTGAAYVVGGTTSAHFPTTPGAFQTANAGREDFFVTKINAPACTSTSGTIVDGQGGIAVNGGQATFFFRVQRSTRKTGNFFAYTDPASGVSLRATGKMVTNLMIQGNVAQFNGYMRAKHHRKISFMVTVEDFAECPDHFSIQASNGYSATGMLNSGDLFLHN